MITLAARETAHYDTLDGNAWDGVIHIRSGTCTGAQAACQDDACSTLRSQGVVVLNAGTYYLIVDGYSAAASGAFTLRFGHVPCDATALPPPYNGTYNGSTAASGNDQTLSCAGGAANDVLYAFPTCGARNVTATTCNATTNYNTALAFRTGTCTAADLACNDNDGACAFSNRMSTVTGAIAARGLHFLVVDGSTSGGGAQTGNYSVVLSGI